MCLEFGTAMLNRAENMNVLSFINLMIAVKKVLL